MTFDGFFYGIRKLKLVCMTLAGKPLHTRHAIDLWPTHVIVTAMQHRLLIITARTVQMISDLFVYEVLK